MKMPRLIAMLTGIFFLVLLATLVMSRLHSSAVEPSGLLPHIDAQEHHRKGVEAANSMGIPSEYFPLTVDGAGTPNAMVTFCEIDFTAYHNTPSQYPMFRDVETKLCGKRITKRLSELTVSPHALQPTGFIFHISRCGSTLTANMLGSDPGNLVFSESGALPSVILHCASCSEETKINAIRALVSAHGNTLKHKRLFFKFQSALGPHFALFRKAFPNVPWIYLYRDPVEVLVSLGSSGLGAPCLRSRHNPPPFIRSLLGKELQSATPTQYCAAHLQYLFGFAHRAAISGGGLVVNYDGLANNLMTHVFPDVFHYQPSPDATIRMQAQSNLYSKSRNNEGTKFEGDSKKKQQTATGEMRRWADDYLGKTYKVLQAFSKNTLLLSNVNNVENVENGNNNNNNNNNNDNSQGISLSKLLARDKSKHLPLAVDQFYRAEIEAGEAAIKTYLPFPELRPLREILDQWPPDNIEIPDIPGIAEGSLQRFDFMNLTQRNQAELLRYHEVPFMLTNVPEVLDVADKWTHDYLTKSFGQVKHRIHQSIDNHFPYYNRQLALKHPEYKPHTSIVDMTYAQWLEAARNADSSDVETEHFYFQTSDFGPNQFISRDLKLLGPRHSWFIVDHRQNRGINCRFGSKGIIAECHYDGGRNFISMLKGAKRYVLLPPSECDNLYLYPRNHPEGRHSMRDWSKMNWTESPLMANAQATQVIVREGEVLYLPSYWFHYIVSLGISAQCNSRSGDALRGRPDLRRCGFY